MKHFILRLPLICLLIVVACRALVAQPAHNFARWEKEIAAYEEKDKANSPPKGEILFIGSSTIRRWETLAQDFPNHRVINRGFGGSQIVDSTHFAERLIFPHSPRTIFLRAGGNDLNAGKSPEQVFAEYKEFVAKVHAKLPTAEIVYVSINPTIARWSLADKERALNTMIKDYVAGKPQLKYIETGDMTLGPDGQPRAELFVADKLHLSLAGYKLLAERVRPYLPK
jgi:lysophospholipase L1-like esterase